MKAKHFILCTLFIYFYISRLSPVQASESTYFIHQDHLGSTSLVTNQGGEVVSQQVYYPYGSTRAKVSESQRVTEREYTGQVSDQDQTGLYYYNARYYDPQIAKFTQADVNQGPNRYLYVSNNPVKLIDPNGQAATSFGYGQGQVNPRQGIESNASSENQSSSGLMAKVMETSIVQNWLSLGAPMLGNTESTQGFNFSKQEDRQAAKPLAIATAAVPALYTGFGVAVTYGSAIMTVYDTLLWKATKVFINLTNGSLGKEIGRMAEQFEASGGKVTTRHDPALLGKTAANGVNYSEAAYYNSLTMKAHITYRDVGTIIHELGHGLRDFNGSTFKLGEACNYEIGWGLLEEVGNVYSEVLPRLVNSGVSEGSQLYLKELAYGRYNAQLYFLWLKGAITQPMDPSVILRIR
jgi:RHS repeat-associated protein